MTTSTQTLIEKDKLEALFVQVYDKQKEALKLGEKTITFANKHYDASRMAQEYLVLLTQLLYSKHKDNV